MLSPRQAVAQVYEMQSVRAQEEERLDRIHQYVTDEQPLPWLPKGAPIEVLTLARMARVNVMRFVVGVPAQALYVTGYESARGHEDDGAWSIWNRNRMDRRQVGVHRAGGAYGAGYVTVLPGDTAPVLRGVSPRFMTTLYGEDDEWPMWALEKRRTTQGQLWRLFDEEAVYWVGTDQTGRDGGFISSEVHNAGVCPVVRFVPKDDLDDPVVGDVEPLIPLQDQVNITTFGLLVAQHYGAFRQRAVIGWVAKSEEELLKAAASRTWTFADHPEDVKVQDLDETSLDGYIESREATLRHIATVAQRPVHELLGTMANLTAEALVAARHSADQDIGEREVNFGESWEQVLELGSQMQFGTEFDWSARVKWKDTKARSMAQMADALGKIATQLNVPPQVLWEMIPGVEQQDVKHWKEVAAEQDAYAGLTEALERLSPREQPAA